MIPEAKIKDWSIEYCKQSNRCYLLCKGIVWAADEDNEKQEQQFAVDKCTGSVLVGGLGVGWIVEQLATKDTVTRIVVIERSPEVIELVWKYLDTKGKAEIVRDDIFQYLRNIAAKENFDYIYFDIWPSISRDIYRDSLLPLRELAEKLVPVARVLCWKEDEMRQKYGK